MDLLARRAALFPIVIHLSIRRNAMATKVGINGFGRIGRQVLKAIVERLPQ